MAKDDIGISASYDTSMIIWDFKKKRDCEKLMGAHKDAVMDFVWHNSLLVSGDKAGVLAIWDLNEGKAVQAIKTHKGAVSNIKFASDGDDRLILSTGLNVLRLLFRMARWLSTICVPTWQSIRKWCIKAQSTV